MNESLFHENIVTSKRVMYTPSTFAKNSLIHLQETGTLTAKSPHTSTHENISSYLFFIVHSGSGVLNYDGKTFILSAGDCVFIDCKNAYYHRTSNNLWKLQWVHFYGPTMRSIFQKYVERGGMPSFHPEKIQIFSEILDSLFSIASSDDYIKDMLINEKLTALLTCIMRESWNPQLSIRANSKRQNLLNIKEYLDENYQKKISLDKLAEEFYINKFYLCRIFKEQFGESINSYLLQTRITHAKQLLRFSNLSLDAIAEECCLGDAAYFSRMFKKVEGMTPGEYRKKW